MKVTGIPRDDGSKDYLISHNGEQFRATRNGSLFCCNGFTGTLKEVKQRVESGAILPSPDSHQAVAQPAASPCDDVGLWDCVHPCALIVRLMTEPHIEFLPEGLDSEITRTLDAYGYLLPDGSYDCEQAVHDYRVNERQEDVKKDDQKNPCQSACGQKQCKER